MPYSITTILTVLNGDLINTKAFDATIDQLLLDSRQVLFPKHSLFFALKGKRHDGHDYLADLYKKGVYNFVVSRKIDTRPFPNANFILVPDCLKALQQIARFHRQQYDITSIGITGSNGKTVVKEWLFQLLSPDFVIVRSPKSYNSQIGVPLSVWKIQEQDQLGIFEAGISQVGEMEQLAPIIDCEIGIFTNIGSAHNEGFPNLASKIKEKLKLFDQTKMLIYRRDDPLVNEIIQKHFTGKCFTWSTTQTADLSIQTIDQSQKGKTTIEALFQNQKLVIDLPFSDAASIENAIHCWALLLYLKRPSETIATRIAQLEKVAMRLELKAGINNCQLINDSYNSDLHSLNIALHFLEQQSKHSKRSIILSDILQSGQTSQTLYREVGTLLTQKNINRFIGIGQAIPAIQAFLPSACQAVFYADTSSFLQALDELHFKDEIILLKGARPFQFERIANRLAQKIHQTVLEINLTAMQHNLNVYSQLLKAPTRLMVMVKASAYGSGSAEVARMLAFQKVDYLCVAYTDEGIVLRKAGIQLPIMVLNPEEATYESLFRYQLEPEIYSLSSLQRLVAYLPSSSTNLSIHLKLETGMHRLGFEPEDLPMLIQLLQQYPNLEVKSIFSHLSASENQSHDAFSQQQADRFIDQYEQITQALPYRPLRHLLNSAGIVRFPQYQLDMVRLGIGLYGIDGSGQIQDQLNAVHTLKARIAQIKTVLPEENIGYGLRGKVEQVSRIATISIGYADGLLRGAGNGRYQVWVAGQAAPIVGQVCMDMCMIDVSHIPNASEGSEVIVFGEVHSVVELAKCLDTIPYEIFTNISERVKRVYYQE